jgi:hypothetical protein
VAPGDDSVRIGRIKRYERGMASYPRISGRSGQSCAVGRLRQLPGKGMFAAPRPDQEYVHCRTLASQTMVARW